MSKVSANDRDDDPLLTALLSVKTTPLFHEIQDIFGLLCFHRENIRWDPLWSWYGLRRAAQDKILWDSIVEAKRDCDSAANEFCSWSGHPTDQDGRHDSGVALHLRFTSWPIEAFASDILLDLPSSPGGDTSVAILAAFK